VASGGNDETGGGERANEILLSSCRINDTLARDDKCVDGDVVDDAAVVDGAVEREFADAARRDERDVKSKI
jgi:hypothetical protein